ncbi:hypothetical protein J416_08509 [Gracilibacillus halophilus YIM-C55.5]|uniref:Heparinase II/III family protein n=1 Tax=Gracilibacillus halophilus YIM-C55.5 TaxID=1308866 RepID=N4WUT2_9BACI|nr:hypothetical protein [Gracilibacillus halophilus]ENH96876.1 hypothetical protein J416_08509 [Gracilibacillus halophilus YIM-C55.5]
MNMYQQLVIQNDKITQSFLDGQILDSGSRYLGGIIDNKTGIPSPSHTGTARVIGTWVSSFVNKDSTYYHTSELKRRIRLALDYMLDQQHEDGTISPGWTNYHSPPDTGFIITGFAQIYNLFVHDSGRESDPLAGKVLMFLERAVPAMLTGGCHTPNHRWVLTSALSHMYQIFGDQAMANRAEEWLNEGIDMTEDGEWTERSNGIYNAVSNISLYHTAQLLHKPKLLDYVRKNLNMMLYFIHPNGEVVTDYSGRQDYGYSYDLSPYHLIYRLMAVEDSNQLYGAMSDLAAESLYDMGPVNNHVLLGYLSFPWIKEKNFDKMELPKSYEIMLNEKYPMEENLKKMDRMGHHSNIEHTSIHKAFGSRIVRFREQEQSVTIMSNHTSFFSLRNGEAKIRGIQMYSSFSPGIIEFDTIHRMSGGYRLEKRMEKGYKGPIPQAHSTNDLETSPWSLLPHQKRAKTHNQTFEMKADIIRFDHGWNIHIHSDKRQDVFTQIVFILDSGAILSGPGIDQIEDTTSFWKQAELNISTGEDMITMDSGKHEHWKPSIGDSIINDTGVQKVKVNVLSPIDHTFRIRLC